MRSRLIAVAKHLKALDLMVVGVGSKLNIFNFNDNNRLKAPCHSYMNLQNLPEIEAINCDDLTGIAILLGHQNICAIDIDGCSDIDLIKNICKILGLGEDYEWIIESGSREGYHIIFQCDDRVLIRPKHSGYGVNYPELPFGTGHTNAYYPPRDSNIFNKIEFKWKGNIVMPGSLHLSGNTYEFRSGIPKGFPARVPFENLFAVRHLYGNLQTDSSHNDYSERGIYSNFLAKEDEIARSYTEKILRPLVIIFHLQNFKIEDLPLDAHCQSMVLTQLSWYVLDRNNNVYKRRTFNFFTEGEDEESTNQISFDKAKHLAAEARYCMFEFLFDLDHSKRIVCLDQNSLQKLKKRIIQSGLYLDNFKKEKLAIYDSQFKSDEFKSLSEKETIFLGDKITENKISLHALYEKFSGRSKDTDLTDAVIAALLIETRTIVEGGGYPVDHELIDNLNDQEDIEYTSWDNHNEDLDLDQQSQEFWDQF